MFECIPRMQHAAALLRSSVRAATMASTAATLSPGVWCVFVSPSIKVRQPSSPRTTSLKYPAGHKTGFTVHCNLPAGESRRLLRLQGMVDLLCKVRLAPDGIIPFHRVATLPFDENKRT